MRTYSEAICWITYPKSCYSFTFNSLSNINIQTFGTLDKQFKKPVYGYLPFGPGFIRISFVFKLSGGRDKKEQTIPAIAEALIAFGKVYIDLHRSCAF